MKHPASTIASFDTPLSLVQMKQSYAGLLRQAGYRTAFLGKYAIGQPRSAPRGLDPLEENNLANEAEHTTTLARMSARCDELRKELR